MTRKQTFGDSFWGSDFCSSAGLDTLVKRLKDGKQVCKEIEEFLKQRAKAEEEYSRALLKISKQTCGQNEIGTVQKTLECLKQQTQETANEHSQLYNQLSERAKQMGIYAEKYRNTRKLHEDTVRKSLKSKADLHKANTQKKKDYDTKCKELENAVLVLQNAKMAGNLTDKHDKAQVQEQKSRSAMDKADQSYQVTNASLEEARKMWEKDMENLCKIYEDLEIERFEYIRNDLWTYTNAVSAICVNVDQQCEVIRKSIEICDIDQDLSNFIMQKGTGSSRPLSIPYKKYGEHDSGPATRIKLERGPPPVPPPDHPHHTLHR